MDQAKWSIPRHRNSRLTKSEMPLQKPRFKIQGCWFPGEKSDCSKIISCSAVTFNVQESRGMVLSGDTTSFPRRKHFASQLQRV